jgi:DNA polymerase III alpha subunit
MHQLAQFGAYSFGRAHAAAYALIAYREMWLKAHYPHEFMLAVMQCEKDEMAVSRYLLECNRLGVKLRPPHVNRSKRDFALVKDRIVGSLTNIKGVGSIASDSILAVRGEQRFRSFVDFMERIDRRKANKRVVLMLVKAGALDKLIPNRKWFIENIDEVWKLLGRKEWQAGVRKLLRQSENEPGFKKEQAAITAAEVCPLTVGKHPIEPYIKFLSKLTPKWIALDDPDMFEQRNGFICGVIVGVRYKRVGEYNPSDEPKDEDERKRLRWGEMFANIQIEQSNGAGKRIKVDVEVFDQYKPILDKGNGTPIAAHVALRQGGGWESLRVHFMVDVAELRRKVIGCEPLSVFDRALLPGAHPVEKHSTANIVRIAMKAKKKFTVVGLVTHLNAKLDRRNEEMAFFGLLDSHGNYLDALCFASSWQRYRKKFGVGDVVRMQLVPQGDSCFLDAREDCRVEKLSAHASL